MEIIYKKNGILVDKNFISLSEIIEKCNIEKLKEDNLLLLIMEWRGWRGFDEGILEKIVLPIEKIDFIKKHILGKTIYFGEIAGKHSDVRNTLDENDIEIIDDPKIILDFLSSNPSGHEYNHSFLNNFIDRAFDGGYDDIGDEIAEEILNMIKK
jgi:hypothetical protein